MIARGGAFAQVVGDGEVGVDHGERTWGDALGMLHDADAPIEVGREAVVLRVVEMLTGDVGARKEGLMTHEHALTKAAPSQVLGRGEPATTDEVTLVIDDVGVAIDDGGLRFSLVADEGGHLAEGGGRVEGVASVEEEDVTTCGHAQGLVHRIIDALVGLADADYLVAHLGSTVALLIVVHVGEGVVVRVAIDDEVLYGGIVLTLYAMDGARDEIASVPSDGGNGDFFLFGRRRCVTS